MRPGARTEGSCGASSLHSLKPFLMQRFTLALAGPLSMACEAISVDPLPEHFSENRRDKNRSRFSPDYSGHPACHYMRLLPRRFNGITVGRLRSGPGASQALVLV